MAKDELYTGFWIDYYDKRYSDSVYVKTFKIISGIIKKYKPDAKVILELACGTGKYTKLFLDSGFAVKAADISPDVIKRAKSRATGAKFEIADMSKISEPPVYDVVACLFESFRYNLSYAICEQTLKQAFDALKPKGLFICDFCYFPPSKGVKIREEVNMGHGLVVKRDELIRTEGSYDVREDRMTIMQKGKILKQEEISRSPLLRISESQMRKMLLATGFKTLVVAKGFREPKSMLFVAQKVV